MLILCHQKIPIEDITRPLAEVEHPNLGKNSGWKKFDPSLDEKFQKRWISMEKPWKNPLAARRGAAWRLIEDSGEQSAFLVPFSFPRAKAGIFLHTNFYSLNGSFYFILQPHITSTKSCKYSKPPWFQKLFLQLCFPSIILETEDIYSWILPIPKLQETKGSLEKNIYRYLFCSLNSSFQAESIHGEWQQTK